MDYLIYSLSALRTDEIDISIISDEERAIAARRGKRYAIIRALLRHEISRRHNGTTPADICFTYGAHGKPECELQHFNLSHSGDCLCFAFHHKSVGVDVERIRQRNFASLAERFMAAEQLDFFRKCGCPQTDFFACWCAAEALVKHAGDTMWNARSYPFLYQNGSIVCQFEHAPCVQLFTPMPGYCGAIAYSVPDPL